MNRNVKTGVYFRNEEEVEFNFFTSLRVTKKIQFVNNVVETIVADNYHFMIKNLMFDFEIIRTFTDVDITEILKSTNQIDAIEKFLEETNIVDIVKSNVDFGVINELNDAVDLAIEYKTGIHTNSITESLGHLIKTIEQKLSSIDTDEMMKMARMLNDMNGKLTAENFIKAYSESDLFKKRYQEVIEDRKNQNVDIKDDDNNVENNQATSSEGE